MPNNGMSNTYFGMEFLPRGLYFFFHVSHPKVPSDGAQIYRMSGTCKNFKISIKGLSFLIPKINVMPSFFMHVVFDVEEAGSTWNTFIKLDKTN